MKIRMFCAALCLFPAIALAGVNTKNGNYYFTYVDIGQTSGDHALELMRTYNSKATEIGWFGFGWGSPFETRLVVMPDSSVVLKENGSGMQNYYAPADRSGLRAGVDRIVAVAVERDKLDPEEIAALRSKLLADHDLRLSSVEKYGIQTQLPEGAVAGPGACTFVTRINDEYRRTNCQEGPDYFDLAGRLIRQEKNNGYKITLHYAGKYPDRIEDTLGQKIFLMWTDAGHVADARSGENKTILHYVYDENDNLRLANQVGGNFYKYEYDNNHNMTEIGYIDRTHTDIQYNEKSLVTSVAESDGSKTTYSYRADPNNPSAHYWATTTRVSATGEQASREEEFSLATDAAGIEKLANLTRTEGERKQNIVWDEQGRIKRVQKPDGGFAEYTYHPTLNKISQVLTEEGDTSFQYNKAGDLILAENSQGQLIRLDYDSEKHIARMVATDKFSHRRELIFKYNALGKPTLIKLTGKGEINVEYDEQGEIGKVSSKQGAKIALEVSQAFQTLLSVVKAGGVDLKM